MGNYISCALSSPASKHSNGAKVIFPDGEIRNFDQSTNAAELMLETPNYFLVNSISLQVGRRFSALSADEELEMGNVYVMVSMRRVNSVITAGDMGSLLVTAGSAVRRASGGKSRILPDLEEAKICGEREVPRLNLDEVEDDTVSELKIRLSMCRSRRPLLETIAEETVW